ncbi:DUF547 domain-containing protein [Sneathiella marina]|uniref:DUF547 domain-containing protein n=1 Tax=Sneathiella marina TaxID=2950108 RepID=A0ABY4W3R7_9PROT|nr:DUF547 domain-containing protein [Sneathiella marina]USG60370.1 DUF547 domain-containing protein [Sneathiella marina]
MRAIPIAFIVLITAVFPQATWAYFDQLDGLLATHVETKTVDGIRYNGVNYGAWGKDPRHTLVRDDILTTNPATLLSKEEKLAFWINAYNVLTIDLIIREKEPESIKNLGGLFSSPWSKHTWEIAGQSYTLDNIEHDIIRPLGEARIHFAINCAAKSCPDLRVEAYRPEKLNTQLADQVTLTFSNGTKGFRKSPAQNIIHVTKVMDWFGEDFDDRNLHSWLMPYFPSLINDQTEIKFFSYDWSLNKS